MWNIDPCNLIDCVKLLTVLGRVQYVSLQAALSEPPFSFSIRRIADVRGTMLRDGIVYGFVLAPSLNLVPRSLSRTRQRLQLWRFRKVHRRKPRRAEQ
jgi:hypothetical protein